MQYRCKPRFFNDWLIGPGFQTITSESLDEQAIELFHQRESQAFVDDAEITQISNKWGLYRGAKISPAHICTWLEQFDNNIEKRLMFKLLQNVRFYNESIIRDKLSSIHDHVRRGLVQEIKQVNKGYERSDRITLLSAFGKLSNSGPTYLRMYATENKIYRASESIVEIEKIEKAVKENERIQAIVFVEDIIASGGTVIDGLRQLNQLCGKLLSDRKVKVIPAAICGFEKGLELIESESNNFPFQVDAFVCDLLTETDKCFCSRKKIFADESELARARQIANDYGYKLVNRMPLGYNDNQLLITFFETCPNNSLPILWSEQTNWKAIFSRR